VEEDHLSEQSSLEDSPEKVSNVLLTDVEERPGLDALEEEDP